MWGRTTSGSNIAGQGNTTSSIGRERRGDTEDTKRCNENKSRSWYLGLRMPIFSPPGSTIARERIVSCALAGQIAIDCGFAIGRSQAEEGRTEKKRKEGGEGRAP